MTQQYCLIADKMHDSIVPMLQEIGFQVDYFPDISRGELLKVIHKYSGLIIRSKTEINAEVIEKAVNLQFVGRAGAGIDQLDVPLLTEKGIAIINAPEGNRDALGEHAVGMLLCLFNKILFGDRQIRNRIWDREGNRGVELNNKTVGLIGYGNMGQAFAKRLQSFGCKVLAYDKYITRIESPYAVQASLEEIFDTAEILSLHIPLTTETRNMCDDAFIGKFKKPFYLINTARGEIVPFSTICKGLQEGIILGAALDVLQNEKINQLTETEKQYFDTLIDSDKVILTPHVAGWTYESYEKINKVLVEKIKKLARR